MHAHSTIVAFLLVAASGTVAAVAGEPERKAAAPLEFRIVAEKDADNANCIHTNTPDMPYLNVAFMLKSLAVDGPDDSPDVRLLWRKIADPVQFLNVDEAADLEDAEAVQARSHAVVGKHENGWYVLLHDGDGKKMAAVPGEATSWSVIRATAVPVKEANGQFSVNAAVDAAGGELLFKLTKEHIGQTMCLCVGGEAISTATIMDAVGREFVITGMFNESRAKEIARKLLTNPAAMVGTPTRRME